MRRRDALAAFGAAALATGALSGGPAARAQQADRMARVGGLFPLAETDPEQAERRSALQDGLERLGWSDGRNARLDFRFAGAPDRFAPLAKDLAASQPDVIFAQTPGAVAALRRETQSVPIVFANVSDPVGAGFVASLSRPGGTVTGMQLFEASVAGKWLAMLRDVAPQIRRAALMANPKTTAYDYFLRSTEAAASPLGLEIVTARVESAADIARAIESLPDTSSGLVLAPDSTNLRHRDLIVALAARRGIPAVYPERNYMAAGGLMSYGVADLLEPFRQAAGYLDRILRGEQAGDLPVQTPTRYVTVLNLKVASALGLTVPATLLAQADEVIE